MRDRSRLRGDALEESESLLAFQEVLMSSEGTRSESTTRLIEVCVEAAAGRCSTATVEEMVREREEGLERNAEAFNRNLAAESAAFNASVGPAADAVREAFRQYGHGLGLVRRWLSEGGAEGLEQACRQLVRAGDGVLDALEHYEMAVLTARGPTDHPILNALLRAAASPAPNPASLTPFVEQVRALVTACSDAPKGAPPLVERLRAGAPDYLDALADFEGFLATGDEALLRSGAARIAETARRLHDGAAVLREAAARPGPTRLSLANALINARDAIVGGQVPMALIAEVTGALEQAFATLRIGLARPLRAGGTALFEEEANRAREAMTLHEEALADLTRYIEVGDADAFAASCEKLEAALAALDEAQKGFELVAERDSKRDCPWCGCANDPRRSNCLACGRLLPRWTDSSGPSSTFSVAEDGDVWFESGSGSHEHIERLVKAAEALELGEIGLPMFAAELDAFEARLRAGEARLVRRPHTETHVAPAAEAIRVISQGVELLRAYVSSSEPSMLHGGLQRVRDGASSLHAAQKAAREALGQQRD